MANSFYTSKYEDTVQCSFFSTKSSQLENLCNLLNNTIAVLSEGYIWHRDEFKVCLSVFDGEKKDIPEHLTSTTCFGDNIEDEWFIVYLVFQITSQYSDLVVQIEDNDGDFILIEAADFLPSWANPDTTKNRVFIYQNKIHIIPPGVVELNSKLDLQDAVHLVIQKTEETKASAEIQEAVLKRFSSYPQKIKESHHRACVTIPADIAALLTLKPSLISPLVTSFCNHDMWDAKCFKNIKFQDCVTIPILFTKYLYAMLVHSKLPRISNLTKCSENKDVVLGCKLACGYEIIMSKLSNNVFASSEYNNFINSLTKNGYFRENIKGSKHYNELLEKAKEYFSNIESPISFYYCYNMSEIKASEEFKTVRDSLINRSITDLSYVDSDEWLNINPDELNTFLNTHYGKKFVESQASTTPQLASQLTNFLKTTSDFEGIEYVEEELDTNKIEFDTEEFTGSIEKMLRLVSCKNNEEEDLESDFSEDDEIVDIEQNLEEELASKLHSPDKDSFKDEYIIKNLLQSIKEEGISGPSSTMLKNIDVSKIELDSDDD